MILKLVHESYFLRLFTYSPNNYSSVILKAAVERGVNLVSKIAQGRSLLINNFFKPIPKSIIIMLFIIFLPIVPDSTYVTGQISANASFNTVPLSERAFGVVLISPTNFFLAALILYLIHELVKNRRKLVFYDFEIPLLCFLAVSVFFSIGSASIQAFAVWFLRLMFAVTVYLIFSRLELTRKQITIVISGLVISILMETAIAVLQFLTNNLLNIPLESTSRFDVSRITYVINTFAYLRAPGTFSHPGLLAASMVLLLPIPVLLSLLRKTRLRLLGFILTGLIVYVILISYSRWGLASAIFGYVTIFVLLKSVGKINFYSLSQVFKLHFLAGLVAVFFALTNPFVATRFLRFDPQTDGGLISRINMYEQSFSAIQTNPTGVGGGNILLYTNNYDSSQNDLSKRYLFQVHNLYLLLLAETGFLGFIAFFWFIIKIILFCFKRIADMSFGDRVLPLLLFSSLFIFLFNGILEPRWLNDRVGFLLCLLLGLLINIITRKSSPLSLTQFSRLELAGKT